MIGYLQSLSKAAFIKDQRANNIQDIVNSSQVCNWYSAL